MCSWNSITQATDSAQETLQSSRWTGSISSSRAADLMSKNSVCLRWTWIEWRHLSFLATWVDNSGVEQVTTLRLKKNSGKDAMSTTQTARECDCMCHKRQWHCGCKSNPHRQINCSVTAAWTGHQGQKYKHLQNLASYNITQTETNLMPLYNDDIYIPCMLQTDSLVHHTASPTCCARSCIHWQL